MYSYMYMYILKCNFMVLDLIVGVIYIMVLYWFFFIFFIKYGIINLGF